MSELNPRTAAVLAQSVYDVQTEALLKGFLMRPEFASSPDQKKHLKAVVGARLVNTRDGFGVCAVGGKGYEKDIFLVFRGSTNANRNADWVSNARIGVKATRNGLVHMGFSNIFTSMLPEINQFVAQYETSGTTFHCVGHSLGGAIATLSANWLKSNKSRSVKLYTFGAPKPGMMIFSGMFTNKLGKENIFRAYHPTDPVPMIPLFPYVHAPLPGYGHYIPANENTISAAAHDMSLYVKSVSGCTWGQLERKKPPYAVESMVEQWLKSNLPVSESSPKIWEWLNAALIFVLKKIIGAAALTFQAGAIGALTFADTIAYVLRKGIDLSMAIGEWVVLLMRKIMQVLGARVIETREELTRDVMRKALIRIMDKTTDEARKAVMKI